MTHSENPRTFLCKFRLPYYFVINLALLTIISVKSNITGNVEKSGVSKNASYCVSLCFHTGGRCGGERREGGRGQVRFCRDRLFPSGDFWDTGGQRRGGSGHRFTVQAFPLLILRLYCYDAKFSELINSIPENIVAQIRVPLMRHNYKG